jgi:hypothetical protein
MAKKPQQVLALAMDGARVANCSSSLIVLAADRGDLPVLGRTVRGVRVFRLKDIEKFARERAALR